MNAPSRILFLCTGNSCRSQMAEALLRHLAGDRFVALSAGSHPAGFIHPLAIETMRRMNVPMEGQYSKSWNVFADEPLDVVITVCDHAAGQACPTWPGHPLVVHWDLPDPVFVKGTDDQRLAAARRVAEQLQDAIEGLIALPFDDLPPDRLRTELRRLAPS